MTRLDLQQKWTTWMFRMVLQDSTVMEELESLMQWFVSDYLNLKLFDKMGQTSTKKQVCSLMRDWRHSWEIWIFWIEPYKVVLGGLGNCQAFFDTPIIIQFCMRPFQFSRSRHSWLPVSTNFNTTHFW
jgi:hypothetical protein